ncbi:hypothetical protein A33Q_1446 [Indibacter alkaliphilus LW1]|uniref:Glycosyl transferase family 1 domain-containing protein n=1 Tax=Indibacter alkaliphilus (strain CCUG 57479 / KCTC 22604 / LW1) TaxID=1189612 RepID=S2DIG0_INDAL|nr:glycosyltransferase [Indibacter alkaliphilus]EOZ98792.1 hypothetical protein A33Q_1446 [Indibacter alkaliphilus LW1]
MKKLLFISWDSDKSNYMETLFFPILQGLSERGLIEARVIQFSWASKTQVSRIQKSALDRGINYTHYKVKRKPFAGLGALEAVYRGVFLLKKYIEENAIDILMPRSTMPATMVNRLWDWIGKSGVKVIFDADGFPLQERVDFTGMKKDSLYYRLLHKEESKMLLKADRVLVRSTKAKEDHGKTIGADGESKISVVANGRDAAHFAIDQDKRNEIRKSIGIQDDEILWVYIGSLGPQYRLEDMLKLFAKYWEENQDSKFLILTPENKVELGVIPAAVQDATIVHTATYTEIPAYLNAGDLGLSLRKDAPSISGLAPIKTGEYLMMGLPVIVSPGVGDTDQLLKGREFAFFWESGKEKELSNWLRKISALSPSSIREFAIPHFSLEKSLDDYSKALTGI